MSKIDVVVAQSGALGIDFHVRSNKQSARYLVPVALALMALAWIGEFASRAHLEATQHALLQAGQRLTRAQALSEQSKRQAEYVAFANDFVARSFDLGLNPANWAEQVISVQQRPMTRADAVALMSQTQTSAVRLFGAEEFDLSPISPDEGLFATSAHPKEELSITLKGRAAFRLQ